MAERSWIPESVFARLVVVMIVLTVSLLLLVAGFFWFIGGPADHLPRAMQNAHAGLLILLLLIITAVVISAHTVLRRLLGPLRDLSDGVARLGAGELNVVLPTETRDEFGKLTRAFNEMVGRVREMIVRRDQLLLDVSHELRSPLTRMKVALELLPKEQQPAGMTTDIAEMERMIAELLELERLRGGGAVNLSRQDLSPVIRQVAAGFDHGPPAVRVASIPGELKADIDADKVRAVLRNLIENAIKYSGPNSPPIELSATRQHGAVIVRIRDFGPGIPAADRERVFEPFFRVDRSRSKSTGGYGLGLSLCKRIMEAHNGSIAVDSVAGQGAAFVLTFPGAE